MQGGVFPGFHPGYELLNSFARVKVAYYPVFLELADQPCLVIGGGAVAERKVEGLLTAGARVTVISPTLTPRLEERARNGQICHLARTYQYGDLTGYRLVFTATGNAKINTAIFQEGQERGVWINAADDPARCNFILPAIVRRGELTVAVATGGVAPALTRVIKEELETYFTADYAMLAQVVADVRRELKQRGLSRDGKAWRSALTDNAFRRLITEGRREEARVYLLGQVTK
jgi:siroheme synthase-like protein